MILGAEIEQGETSRLSKGIGASSTVLTSPEAKTTFFFLVKLKPNKRGFDLFINPCCIAEELL